MKQPYKPVSMPIHDLAWEQMIPRLGMAQAAVARFDGILHAMINPELLLSPLTTQEAVLSSKIEGTQASLEDVMRYDVDPRKDAERKDDIKEVQNYRDAMHKAVGWLREAGITIEVMTRIHKALLAGVRGESKQPGHIRESQNYIGYRGEPMEKAIFIPPSPVDLKSALPDLQDFMMVTHRDVIVRVPSVSVCSRCFFVRKPPGTRAGSVSGQRRCGRLVVPGHPVGGTGANVSDVTA